MICWHITFWKRHPENQFLFFFIFICNQCSSFQTLAVRCSGQRSNSHISTGLSQHTTYTVKEEAPADAAIIWTWLKCDQVISQFIIFHAVFTWFFSVYHRSAAQTEEDCRVCLCNGGEGVWSLFWSEFMFLNVQSLAGRVGRDLR